MNMKISELAKTTKLSSYTLRYYEQIGLLPRPHRSSSGHRIYDETTVAWLEFIGRLKSTDMPIKQIQLYAKLRQKGQSTELERQKLLVQHLAKVRLKRDDIETSLTILNEKISTYAKSIKQKENSNAKPNPK